MELKGKRVGFAMCGSFCTFSHCFEALETLLELGCEIIPIMSFNAYSLDTRFGKAKDHIERLEGLCGRPVIHTIEDAEPIGPKNMTDILLTANCTGNTLAKLAGSITDRTVNRRIIPEFAPLLRSCRQQEITFLSMLSTAPAEALIP